MIGSVSGSGQSFGSSAVSGVHHHHRPHGGKAMQPAADLLDMSQDQLKSALTSGSSLSDLASQQGVSRTDLLAAIAKGIQSVAPAGAPQPTGGIDALAAKIADRTGPPPADASDDAGSDSTPTPGSNLLAQVSQLLGVSTDQLLDQLSQQRSSSDPGSYGVSASIFGGIQVDTQA